MARNGLVLAEESETASRSHVGSLPGLVARVLARAGLAMDDLEGLAISIGPGSFTGLRIGLGFVKGVAFAGGLPVAAVPTLEALAEVAGGAPGETVCAALDARKREVYAALFRVGAAGRVERTTEDLALAADALAARLPAGAVLVGDAAEAYPEAFGPEIVRRPFTTHHPRGGVVARLGAERLAAGAAAEVGPLEPVYVRPPEAELARSASAAPAR